VATGALTLVHTGDIRPHSVDFESTTWLNSAWFQNRERWRQLAETATLQSGTLGQGLARNDDDDDDDDDVQIPGAAPEDDGHAVQLIYVILTILILCCHIYVGSLKA